MDFVCDEWVCLCTLLGIVVYVVYVVYVCVFVNVSLLKFADCVSIVCVLSRYWECCVLFMCLCMCDFV